MRVNLVVRSVLLALCAGLMSSAVSQGGQLVLLDGTVLKGGTPIQLSTVGPKAPKPGPDKVLNMAIASIAEGGAVRFFVSRLQLKDFDSDNDLRHSERFKLDVTKRPKPKKIEQVAGQLETSAWDKFGHRIVKYKSGDKTVPIMQEITELNPKYCRVTAMDYLWEFGIPTNSIPDEALDQILHQATKAQSPDDRLAIARFYLEGEFYALAEKELQGIRKDFPTQSDTAESLLKQLRQYVADQALGVLEERREAGQYEFAYETAKKFLKLNLPDVSPATMQKLKQSVADHEAQRSKFEDIRLMLGQLQAKLSEQDAVAVAPLRRSISNELHPATIDRLAPFLLLADVDDRKPSEKMALALSGWVLGADQADTDLKVAIRLWQGRNLLIEYFRASNAAERDTVTTKLATLESVGAKQIARLIPLLPPRFDTVDVSPTVPATIDVDRRSSADVQTRYDVLLPPEYHPARSYPVVIVLHAEGMQPKSELRWWARQAQRFGYIILAPHYMSEKQRSYDYSYDAHYAVLETIRDARGRFNVNSDRIFMGGHGAGGDATFDIGYSHPDLFAGIMPITALCEKFSEVYWKNAKHLPQFIISGELDRTALEDNTQVIDHMMVAKFPIVYAVFMGRGHDDFQSEDGRLFDWMSRQKRGKPPTEIEVTTMRTSDNQFWWWKFSNFPNKFGVTSWPNTEKGQPKPVILNSTARRAKGANVINIQCGARLHSLWLFPEVVSFEKTLIVRQGNTQIYHQIPEPDSTAMMEDFRLRGDRQQIAWGYIELGSSATRSASK